MAKIQEKKIINSCHTCRTSIYEGEPIYTSSKGQSSGYLSGAYGSKSFEQEGYRFGGYGGRYSGDHSTENWSQCAWCYDHWQTELAKNKSFWWKWWLGWILFSVIVTVIISVMVPAIEDGSQQQNSWYRTKIFSLGSWKISAISPIVFFVSLFLASAMGMFFQPPIDRYKLRNKPIKL